jgi:asparagine synthase (glutamine-hydrolysing)
MISASGRYVITFNGEVYNFRSIAQQLDSAALSLRSDTAVMLAAIEEWGLERAVNSFRGMFAFGLWDTVERTLHLVRDRLGVKPLYFGWCDGSFAFASTLRPLWYLFRPSMRISPRSVADFFHYCNVPAPYSIFQNVFKLLPGSILTVQYDEFASPPDWFSENGQQTRYRRYWSVRHATERAKAETFQGSESEAVERFMELFKESISLRTIADVPLGVFLSGGIDSSLLAAAMQTVSSTPIRTFTIGSANPMYDEAPYARAIARHLGASHEELYISDRDAYDVVPHLAELWDEPFADSSQIPTFLVSRLARQHVTVALSGDGGDELCLGYTRYATAARLWPYFHMVPRWLRASLAATVRRLPQDTFRKLLPFSSGVGRGRRSLGERLERFAPLLAARNKQNFCHLLMNHWHQSPLADDFGARGPCTLVPSEELERFNIAEAMTLFDLQTYLPDDLLVKVDRASMAVGLEAREPYLDHHLVEFFLGLPLRYKADSQTSKRLLKLALHKFLPREMIERPKVGFSMPIGDWLRNGLRDWAEELLSTTALQSTGFLNERTILALWNRHISGESDQSLCLWDVLMFQSWHARWMSSAAC